MAADPRSTPNANDGRNDIGGFGGMFRDAANRK
jgi:hypothetical protein